MATNKLLIIDQGDSLLSNLTHQLDARAVSLTDTPVVYAVQRLTEARRVLEKDPDAAWKVVVVGREAGLEPEAQETIMGVRAQFGADSGVPIMLLTKSDATQRSSIAKRVGDSVQVTAADPQVDFDLQDVLEREGSVPKAAEEKFDAMIATVTQWVSTSPEKARAFPKR